MLLSKCLCRNRLTYLSESDSEPFSLPSPLPDWPQGRGFASGRINLGELEVSQITKFESVWRYNPSRNKNHGVTFYKPVGIPDGFHCLGHYCQPNNHPLRGFVLVAREVDTHTPDNPTPPALCLPLDYALVRSPDNTNKAKSKGCGYIWLPRAPEGYKPVGFLVTNEPEKPGLDEARCVRTDLTDECDAYRLLHECRSRNRRFRFRFWSTRPRHRGAMGKGVPVGTFFCSGDPIFGDELCNIGCLKNLNPTMHAMPNLDQIHALVGHYGPTVFFHPEETYLPSSVSWLFENGALLYRNGVPIGEAIDARGTNLPAGGTNDGEFWIDLPADKRARETAKRGSLESAKLYVHAKPALGGTFADLAMWVFFPFNGPATVKVGPASVALAKIGGHVCDWEHFTLRIANFTGELWSVYYAQHSGGKWVDAHDLEYSKGNNKPVVYSSKHGHASYPRPGTYIQGSSKLGVGIRNDVARSDLLVDSSARYELVSAEYLGDGVVAEPCWLQYMRLWGPKIVYDSRTEVDKKKINGLPTKVGYFPAELYGESGPTGPKEKNYWFGDERG